MIRYDVRADGVRETIAGLKELNPKLVTAFRRDLRGTAKDMASIIKSSIQVTPPLSGMSGYSSRSLIWHGAVTKVSISLAGSRKRDVTPLLSIKVDSPKGAPGYMAAETAGKRNPIGNTPQGSYFIAAMTEKFGPLKGKGGNRIAWKYFWGQRALLNRAAMMVVDKYERMVNREGL